MFDILTRFKNTCCFRHASPNIEAHVSVCLFSELLEMLARV